MWDNITGGACGFFPKKPAIFSFGSIQWFHFNVLTSDCILQFNKKIYIKDWKLCSEVFTLCNMSFAHFLFNMQFAELNFKPQFIVLSFSTEKLLGIFIKAKSESGKCDRIRCVWIISPLNVRGLIESYYLIDSIVCVFVCMCVCMCVTTFGLPSSGML